MEPAPAPVPAPPMPAPGGRYVIDRNISFQDRGRIPAIVTDLPEFRGNARNLSQWILDVEDILELYDDLKESFHYHLILKTIRRKIKDEANDVLVTNNTPTTWESIKQVLRLYYADKRDLITLDNQLKDMVRGRGESIETYYSKIREMVTLISSAISMDDEWRGHEEALIKLYNKISLDRFIRGLGEPLSLFCKNYKPNSLAQAYHYCVDYLNVSARNAPFSGTQNAPVPAPRGNLPQKPVHPPRMFNNSPIPPPRQNNFQHPSPRNNHMPNAAHRQNPFQNQPFRNYQQFNPPPRNVFVPNRTFYPRQNNPEPMEIDPSVRSRQVNYGNRPQLKMSRPPSNSMQAHIPPPKRFANLLDVDQETEQYNNLLEENYDYHEHDYEYDFHDQINESNSQNQDEPNDIPEETTETNFLEKTPWENQWKI